MSLKTDYKDYILDTMKNTTRKFNMINNPDGTVSFEDVSEYSQTGDSFGANDINNITKAIGANTKSISQQSEAIVYLTNTEFEQLTQEELIEKYNKGTKLVIITDENTNLVPTSISKSGAVYNGCGYMNDYRINSSGEIVASERSTLTGFIPYEYGKNIEISGGLNPIDTGGQYIATYNDVFELIGVNYLSSLVGNSNGTSICTDNNIYVHTVKTGNFVATTNINMFKSAKYIRVSINPCIGNLLIVKYID